MLKKKKKMNHKSNYLLWTNDNGKFINHIN